MSPQLRRIHYHILRSFFHPFLLTFFIALFFLLLQFVYRHLGELVGKGVDLAVIAEMMFYVSVGLLPFNFPLAILLASVLTFGTLGENSELLAMKAAGMSLFTIIKPLLLVVVVMALVAFLFANNIIPETNLRYMSILNGLQKQQPELILQDGVFSNQINGYSIKVENVDKHTQELYNIMLYNHSTDENDGQVTVARHGKLEFSEDKRYVILNLNDGKIYGEVKGGWARTLHTGNLHLRSSFDKQVLRIRVFNFDFSRTEESVFTNHHRMLSSSQLAVMIDSLKNEQNKEFYAYVQDLTPVFIQPYFQSNPGLRNAEKTGQQTNHIQKLFAQQNVFEIAKENMRAKIKTIGQWKLDYSQKQKRIRRYQIEKQRKLTLSLSVLIFFLIGSSFGAVVQKGGISLPMVFSFLLLVVYFVIGLLGERMVLAGTIPVFQGAWLPYCALLPLAIWLIWLSANDSSIIISGSYRKRFKKCSKEHS